MVPRFHGLVRLLALVSVMGAIAPQLEQAEIERAKRKPTESLDAYDYFLRGMASIYKWTREANDGALRLYYKAIELDPDGLHRANACAGRKNAAAIRKNAAETKILEDLRIDPPTFSKHPRRPPRRRTRYSSRSQCGRGKLTTGTNLAPPHHATIVP